MAKSSKISDHPGRFAYEGLNRVIHEKARLGIVASLTTHPQGLPFNDLKDLCNLTDGNLSRHLQTLSEAGLVDVKKEHRNNRPLTLVRLTTEGRRQFVAYIAVLESIVSDSAEARRTSAAGKLSQGWSPT
jgi:DNA-binding MarR family transcriptional regulator